MKKLTVILFENDFIRVLLGFHRAKHDFIDLLEIL